MAFLTPAYRLTFRETGGGIPGATVAGALGVSAPGAGRVIDTTTRPQASTVTDLAVTLTMDGGADGVTLLMGQVGRFRPTVGQQLDVDLGYADGELSPVVRTTIAETRPDLVNRRLVAHGSAEALQHTRLDRTFEGATAGDVVRELADLAGVEVANVEAGITFPAYVVDARRNAYQHVGDLADLCGFDRYVDTDGKLVFAFFSGGRTAHVFDFARHILELDVRRRVPGAGQVAAFGDSPGAARGETSWAWLTKDFGSFAGRAGSGTRTFLLERPALRTGRAARQAAQAALTTFLRRSVQGQVLVTGSPQVRLGDAVQIAGTPEEDLDGTYQVRGVTHHVSKLGGFTTRVHFRSIDVPAGVV